MFESSPSFKPRARSAVERRQRVVVQLEVVRVRPRARPSRRRRRTCRRAPPIPSMIRCVKRTQISSSWSSSGGACSVANAVAARVVVARRVEVEPVARTERAVALGPEVGAGLGDREVDVEDDARRGTRATIASRGDRAPRTQHARGVREPRLPPALGRSDDLVRRRRGVHRRARLARHRPDRQGELARVRARPRVARDARRRCSGAACSPTATRAGC